MRYDASIPQDHHEHQCPNRNCGHKWVHIDQELFNGTHEQFDAAHHCPKCGAEQYYKSAMPPREEIRLDLPVQRVRGPVPTEADWDRLEYLIRTLRELR